MTDDTEAIALAIKSLKSKAPKQRGKRAVLVPFLPAIRELIASGWSRAEIVAEIRTMGGSVSPALLRDVLVLPPNKRNAKTTNKRKPRHDQIDRPLRGHSATDSGSTDPAGIADRPSWP